MEIAPEGVGLLFAEIGFDAANGEVHHGEAARGGVALLTVNADVAVCPLRATASAQSLCWQNSCLMILSISPGPFFCGAEL